MPVKIMMDMPKCCRECKFCTGNGFCLAKMSHILGGTMLGRERSLDCPLKE